MKVLAKRRDLIRLFKRILIVAGRELKDLESPLVFLKTGLNSLKALASNYYSDIELYDFCPVKIMLKGEYFVSIEAIRRLAALLNNSKADMVEIEVVETLYRGRLLRVRSDRAEFSLY